jgi:hypothetical protein
MGFFWQKKKKLGWPQIFPVAGAKKIFEAEN